MKKAARAFRFEKLARRFDEEVAEAWSKPFGRLLLEGLPIAPDAHVLDVCCATGGVALSVLSKLGPSGHVVAMDGRGPLVDIARMKAPEDELGHRLFLRTEQAFPSMTFASGAFDLVLASGWFDESEEGEQGVALVDAIAEMARVTAEGGTVRVTLPLAGTWQPFYDVADEVLLRHDKRAARRKVAALARRSPTPAHVEAWLEQAGLGEVEVVADRFTLLFGNAESLFYSPLVELGPLTSWKRALGPEMQWAFGEISAALEVYFRGRPIAIEVVAGRGHGVKVR